MPVALLKETKLTIGQILQYTNQAFHSRFDNYKRDILTSKIKIIKKTSYVKDRQGIFEEKLEIISVSAPQYMPYIKHTKGKQRKYQHQYNIVIQIAKDDNDEYSLNSKIRWRVGSFKQVPRSIPQSKVKTIHGDTRQKIMKKYEKEKDETKRASLIKKELQAVRKKGKYLCDGDFIAQELGINLDNYYRNFYVQKQFGCLYGPLPANLENSDEAILPFFCKHFLGVLFFLVQKKIIKGLTI